MEIIIEGYLQDEPTKQLLSKLSVTRSNQKGYSLKDGIVRYKGRIWLGKHYEAHKAIQTAMHDSGLGGHSGISATYNITWPKMKENITDYVSKCEVCQQAKLENSKLPGLLQPLLVPDQAWQTVSLDFTKGVPKSNICSCW